MVEVNGSALAVGDVILDRANTHDNHPYVVVARAGWTVTFRNCTSFDNSALTLLKVVMADKTGDQTWAGKDSYVVKSGDALNLSTIRDTSYQDGFENVVATVPVPMLFDGPQGQYWAYVPQQMIVTQPRIVQRFSDIKYQKVGTIVPTRMAEIVAAL